ncbi:hypothetical protein TNCT_662661 [Trichonephila clavata]|uniref:Uncharacterized protein n=1 Tax=Trichonephila clavata TaxID=2740835 RepID=A0A8X6HVV0_TRICU|nr:hypothetical protein TNCT_662661 [Trichonephila clavata]
MKLFIVKRFHERKNICSSLLILLEVFNRNRNKALGRPDSHFYMFFTKPVLKRLKELDVTFNRSMGLTGLTLLTKNKAFQFFTFLEFYERNNAAGKYAITRLPPKLSLR